MDWCANKEGIGHQGIHVSNQQPYTEYVYYTLLPVLTVSLFKRVSGGLSEVTVRRGRIRHDWHWGVVMMNLRYWKDKEDEYRNWKIRKQPRKKGAVRSQNDDATNQRLTTQRRLRNFTSLANISMSWLTWEITRECTIHRQRGRNSPLALPPGGDWHKMAWGNCACVHCACFVTWFVC